jgi:energy-coupling factor transporter ATP-binding protein EcfA2
VAQWLVSAACDAVREAHDENPINSCKELSQHSTSSLENCGDLNILIGKNNAGKSTFLSTIELMLAHLQGESIAGSWEVDRPADQFTNRRTDIHAEIAIEFDLPAEVNSGLRKLLAGDAAHLERSVQQLEGESRIVFVLDAAFDASGAYLYLSRIVIGTVQSSESAILTEGVTLLAVPADVAAEMYQNQIAAKQLRNDAAGLDKILDNTNLLGPYFDDNRNKELPFRYVIDRIPGARIGRMLGRLEVAYRAAPAMEDFVNAISQMRSEVREQAEAVEQRETAGSIKVFAGDVKRQPKYISWLMAQYGATKLLQLKENKQRIGPKEAQALLELKVRRGGAERLTLVKNTVSALLGVSLDAFQPEGAVRERQRAEMDVDDFLVEANGSGIRDALRLILDFELTTPELVLIEEPEVHLHPGLARSIEQYLRGKSKSVQIFLTTHSTEFVDSASFQNVYLISRLADRTAKCNAISNIESGLQIPVELGLRASSIFMYDRLVFVEGPSDEEILRELATTIDVDLAKANVGFVHMGGVRNFAYFAAESTLDLLGRRQVGLWFVADRDERDDEDVKQMLRRLAGRAQLIVWSQRELENYLLDPAALVEFIKYKQSVTANATTPPSLETVARETQDSAAAMLEEIIRLRVERFMLSPLHFDTRKNHGSIEERLSAGLEELQKRVQDAGKSRQDVTAEVDASWPQSAQRLAPGSHVIEAVVARYGVKFNKAAGDGQRLASYLDRASIAEEIRSFLKAIVS